MTDEIIKISNGNGRDLLHSLRYLSFTTSKQKDINERMTLVDKEVNGDAYKWYLHCLPCTIPGGLVSLAGLGGMLYNCVQGFSAYKKL